MPPEKNENASLSFAQASLTVPTATWKEILASRVDQQFLYVWGCVWLAFLILSGGFTYVWLGNSGLDVAKQIEAFAKLVEEVTKLFSNHVSAIERVPYCTCIPAPAPSENGPTLNIPVEKSPIPEKGPKQQTEKDPKKTEGGSLIYLSGRKAGVSAQEIPLSPPEKMIDWLVQINLEFQLGQETLPLAVKIFEKFRSLENVTEKDLKLVAITSIFIACKYAEVLPPDVKDILLISKEVYGIEDVLAMEKEIVGTLLRY